MDGSIYEGLKKSFLFMTNQGVYRGSINKQVIGKASKFEIEIDPTFSCFPGRHVSSMVQLATSTSPKLIFTVNDFRSIYMLYDLKQMKIVNHVKNPTTMTTFFGGFAIEGTPLVLVRDAKHIGVYNAETFKAASLFESRFDIDTNRLSTFSVEREGESVSIYVLEYS